MTKQTITHVKLICTHGTAHTYTAHMAEQRTDNTMTMQYTDKPSSSSHTLSYPPGSLPTDISSQQSATIIQVCVFVIVCVHVCML